MKPIATSYQQAEAYFSQGAKCVRCLHGEIVQDAYCAEDAYTFFAQYDKLPRVFWWLIAASLVVWFIIAWAAGSL